jgi:hypothetical protein
MRTLLVSLLILLASPNLAIAENPKVMLSRGRYSYHLMGVAGNIVLTARIERSISNIYLRVECESGSNSTASEHKFSYTEKEIKELNNLKGKEYENFSFSYLLSPGRHTCTAYLIRYENRKYKKYLGIALLLDLR